MDSSTYSKKAKYVEEDDSEWSDDGSESESEWSDDGSETESDDGSESDYATDEELDEWNPNFVSSIQIESSLSVILQRIANLKEKYYRSILNEFHSVCRWFNGDHDKIAEFFLPLASDNNETYDLKDFKHIYLLKKLIDYTGPKQPCVREYLDTVEDVLPLGIVRVKRGNTVYYRIRTGLTAHS